MYYQPDQPAERLIHFTDLLPVRAKVPNLGRMRGWDQALPVEFVPSPSPDARREAALATHAIRTGRGKGQCQRGLVLDHRRPIFDPKTDHVAVGIAHVGFEHAVPLAFDGLDDLPGLKAI